MSVQPKLIRVIGGNTPVKYKFSQLDNMEMTAATAQFDGTSAAAAFWPALAVYASDGTLIGRFIPPLSVAAGDTAEVTFGPF